MSIRVTHFVLTSWAMAEIQVSMQHKARGLGEIFSAAACHCLAYAAQVPTVASVA